MYSLQDMKTYLLFRAIDPLMLYLFFALFGAAILGSDYIEFIIIGNIVFISSRTFLLNLIAMFKYERQTGTLGLNIASPTSTLQLLCRRLMIPFIDSLFVIAVSCVYAYFLFGIRMELSLIPYLCIVLLVLLFSSGSLALLVASISLAFKDVNLLLNSIIGAMQIFCGVYFSITLFPHYVEVVCSWLPMTNSIIAIRDMVNGEVVFPYPLVLKEFLIGVVILVMASVSIKIMETIAKKTGALLEIE